MVQWVIINHIKSYSLHNIIKILPFLGKGKLFSKKDKLHLRLQGIHYVKNKGKS